MEKIEKPFEIKQEIREFYKAKDPEWFVLPPRSNHRQFKFHYIKQDGSIVWVKIRDRIDSKRKLKKHLVNFAPLDAYCTVSYWLNPTVLGKKSATLPKKILLGADFLVDVDLPFMENKEMTKKVTKRLNPDKVVFTGRGSHAHVFDFYKVESNDPRKREENCEEKMKEKADKLGDLRIDREISIDSRRIRKVPNTITRYGNLAEEINNIDSFQPKQIIEIKDKNKNRVKLADW